MDENGETGTGTVRIWAAVGDSVFIKCDFVTGEFSTAQRSSSPCKLFEFRVVWG